ncbi:hypothetical protein [Streptomyces sp. NPDC002467]|uniref:hypothetical protein n=1 Tax=Streptomyces sp. NPDC002467 TaxID=3364647 RepID=UPI0036AF9198
MSEQDARRGEVARRAAAADAAGRPEPTGADDAGAGGHTAKRQRTGTGREEQVRPHPERAADER